MKTKKRETALLLDVEDYRYQNWLVNQASKLRSKSRSGASSPGLQFVPNTIVGFTDPQDISFVSLVPQNQIVAGGRLLWSSFKVTTMQAW